MADGPDKQRDAKEELKRRLNAARADLTRRQAFINECYRLGMPYRERVGSSKSTPIEEADVTDILDATFMEATDDFASDMIATFTPAHEPWVKHEITSRVPDEQRRQVQEQIRSAVSYFWDDVQESSYYEAADECFHDLMAGTMACRVRDYGAANPICYEPIAIRDLLIDVGPNNAPDARFTEGQVIKRHLMANYGPWIEKSASPHLKARLANAREDTTFKLCDGCHRVWDKPGYSQWRRVVLVEDEIIYERIFDGDNRETIIVARWRTERKSGYGVGPGWVASPYARVLNELNAIMLAQMHKVVDPTVAYSDPDGVANLEQGVGAGDWIQLGEGFSVQEIGGDKEFSAPFYTREDLRMSIKAALYQDKPDQRGKTPPTATQWADEAARAAQRWEIPRGRIIREWVMPIVRVHQQLRVDHGLFPPIKIGSDAVILRPQSPQAKARAAERLAKAERVLMTAASPAMQMQAQAAIDGIATLQNIKAELSDEIVRVRTQEELQQMAAMAQQAMAAQGGGGEPQQ